ncbi:acylphosphatase 1-like protein [Reticulomyxa filosa]|uniref:acylphosphatase n=1 Tax=Reticulomyxa filosa TaxID=46433 RepID=X6MPN5_RETFI|nr:acylphosphatase 1-like protein [Reticulomyxa filosa]|eukprot:ETO15641.1 acylphosphatase 1-like protein [Reticulomyxa filosa]
MSAMSSCLIRLRYEISGRVQGVYFRKTVEDYISFLNSSQKTGITGWVQNSNQGTVIGIVETEDNETKKHIDTIKQFLTKGIETYEVQDPWLKSEKQKFAQKGKIIKVKQAKFDEKKVNERLYKEFIVDKNAKFESFQLI